MVCVLPEEGGEADMDSDHAAQTRRLLFGSMPSDPVEEPVEEPELPIATTAPVPPGRCECAVHGAYQ